MNDMISRKALYKAWDKLDETQGPQMLIDDMIRATQDAPTVDAQPVHHGRWLEGGECSRCHEFDNRDPYGSKYCPNCGAKMDCNESRTYQHGGKRC